MEGCAAPTKQEECATPWTPAHDAADLSGVLPLQVGRAQQLTAQVVSFLEARDGSSAATADLVDHFQPRVPATQMPLFRQLLKQVTRPFMHLVALWLTQNHAGSRRALPADRTRGP